MVDTASRTDSTPAPKVERPATPAKATDARPATSGTADDSVVHHPPWESLILKPALNVATSARRSRTGTEYPFLDAIPTSGSRVPGIRCRQ